MKKPKFLTKEQKVLRNASRTIHYYIDESGSPEFYGKKKKLLVGAEGYSPILIIGLVSVINRNYIFRKIEKFTEDLLANNELKNIYSLHQPGWYLHAKDDHPEVLDRFFNFLASLDFRGYFIIGRKSLRTFHRTHKAKESNFYFDLIQNLLRYRITGFKEFKIYLSRRSGNSIEAFKDAIESSIENYNKSTNKDDITPTYTCTIVPSKSTPESSIVDYMLWALQRYILKEEETYYNLLIDKYELIYDIYGKTRGENSRFYNYKNRFDLKKAGKFV